MKILSALLFVLISVNLFSQSKEEISRKADSLYGKELYSEALQEYMNGLSMFPDDRDFLLQKAVCLDRLGEVTDAYESYSVLIQKYPTYSNGYNNRAMLLLRAQEFELSLKDIDKAIEYAESDSIRVGCLMNRGAVEFHTRDFEGAYRDLNKALGIDPKNIDVMNNLAAVCNEVGKPEMTFVYLKRILEVDPRNIGATSNFGFAYQERGQYDSAIYFFNKVILLDPKEALGYSNRGFCYYKKGKYELALKDVDLSLDLYPSNAYAHRTRALINIARGKTDDACKDMEMALLYKFTITYGNEVEELKKKYCK